MQTQQQWHLYIIRCKDGALYTGVTLDVERRFLEHQAQGARCAKYLRGKGPLKLVFHECIGEKSKTYQLERLIKRLSKSEKEDIIKTGDLNYIN